MKVFYNAVISLFLILLTAFVLNHYVMLKQSALENLISFEVEHGGNIETIRLWRNEEGKYFVFLPSYAELENVCIRTNKSSGGTKLYFDDKQIEDGDSLKDIELEKAHLICKGDVYPVQFLKSANVASMHINTQTGTMDRIYADKSNKEKANVTLYTSDGKLDYSGRSDSIKCRGNVTFDNDKKSFLLNLGKAGDLLGMGAAKKWILLSNAYDPTNLRNKLVFDFAKATSLKWTPDCEYVDLYLNGEYNGLYLLCEKVEVGENRLELKGKNDFLCKNEWNERIGTIKNPFITAYGRATEITFPNNPSSEQKKQIINDVHIMENEILNKSDNSVKHINLTSWVDKYLIDEITENIDADFCSSYFYCEYKDGEPCFYAGPIWDYDITFGNSPRNVNPKTFIANQEHRLSDFKAIYYPALYNKNFFYEKVVKRYTETMLPYLIKLVETGIDEQEHTISTATNLNKIRWNLTEEDIGGIKIKNYLKDRLDFLNDVWIYNIKYCTINIEDKDSWVFYSVLYGKTAKKMDLNIFDLEKSTFIDADTGEEFDFNLPVFKDKAVYIKTEDDINEEEIGYNTGPNKSERLYLEVIYYLKILFFTIFLIILALLTFISIKNQQRGQRK